MSKKSQIKLFIMTLGSSLMFMFFVFKLSLISQGWKGLVYFIAAASSWYNKSRLILSRDIIQIQMYRFSQIYSWVYKLYIIINKRITILVSAVQVVNFYSYMYND